MNFHRYLFINIAITQANDRHVQDSFYRKIFFEMIFITLFI